MSQRQRSKIEYYSNPGVVERYESWRFGSAGGRHAGRREIDAVLRHTSQLPRQAGILDMPIGTGRLSSALLDAGFDNVYGCDSSESMLATAALVCGDRVSYTRGDAFTTGFADSSFDAVISLRFFFHYRDTRALIAEMARVLKPDGLLIFDTLRWSPALERGQSTTRARRKRLSTVGFGGDRRVGRRGLRGRAVRSAAPPTELGLPLRSGIPPSWTGSPRGRCTVRPAQ
jgi:ubiquinone/menaquinone biosynthesis C-methylase UbiE